MAFEFANHRCTQPGTYISKDTCIPQTQMNNKHARLDPVLGSRIGQIPPPKKKNLENLQAEILLLFRE